MEGDRNGGRLKLFKWTIQGFRVSAYPIEVLYKFGAYTDQYSPGDLRRIGIKDITSVEWEYRLGVVNDWLLFLNNELEASDLWREILQHRPLYRIALAPELDNSPLSRGKTIGT